ncbi:MAG TPA: CHASE2 domain-containing protein [Solirubrobacteraceae bacterium]|jgi:CHASE2 domain-containing sensor protein/tRNA A-37 threonylcarbamoyl transferase component Bud32|nr:CHASE2 domain-containing protein [Solirubrobacteraceae bacterium]
MHSSASRRPLVWLLLVASLAGGVGMAAYSLGALGWLQRSTVDVRFSLRGKQRPNPGVVVVGIDNASLGGLPRYPFSRTLHARVIDRLHDAGARLIVYDISFDRPTTPRADEALLGAAAAGAPVVFATSLISSTGRTQVLGGAENLRRAGDRAAAADLLPDSDGVLRHTLEQVNGLPTVAAAVAQELGRSAAARARLRHGWIDFPGPPGTVGEISFGRVLRGRFDPASVRGKVVVVGATASVLQDLHDTAAGSPMSGPEVQADAIATALAGSPLRSPRLGVTLLLIALLAAIAPIAGVRLGTLGVALVGVAAFALWSLAAQLAFDADAVLDYADPLLALALGTGGTLVGSLWVDRRERMRLRELFAAADGAMVEQVLHPAGPRPIEPTAIIAGYRLEEVVGRGGMGVVYCARQLALERPVAVKLIVPDRYNDPVLRERFKSESMLAASIEHANVIPVYEAGEDEGLLFIAMRLVDGVDLAQLLSGGALAPERALALVAQLAGALDAAHARGLVHRDVKPANALVTRDQREHLYLTDFGIATHVGAHSGMTGDGWVGTLDYLAPEQIEGGAVDARADTYALAGVMHHCLTGQVPFQRESPTAKLWAQLNAPPPAPSALDPTLPQRLDDVIARGMAKDPAARFHSTGELAGAFAEALGVVAVARSGGTRVERDRRAPQPGASAPTIVPE